eukprot:Gregarina_sp_Pseudo_9__5984@NODE_984_length_2004_cov_21_670738_g922_i0_p1_GENE_NODE_984_length_2004_cov_21_670738_g922_i0NODE_984_length_2004_cov_21_670738_g922_i0_p1_ORF_typecomplete_len512_score162_33_NODE_984_length_2004_cov_21_670738_g922_i04681970
MLANSWAKHDRPALFDYRSRWRRPRVWRLTVWVVVALVACVGLYTTLGMRGRWSAEIASSEGRSLAARAPLQLDIKVHQGQGVPVDPVTHKIALEDVAVPIECHNVLLHVVTEGYEDKMEIWIRRQKEWVAFQPADCFFSINHRGSLAEYHPVRTWNLPLRKQIIELLPFRSRYDVQAALASMALRGYLRRPLADGDAVSAPWVYFTDVDTLHLNKDKSIDSLVARLQRGLDLNRTAETRVCGTSDYFACEETASLPESVEELAYVVPLDLLCHDDWMFNAGTVLWRPSRLLGMIAQSVLWGFNDTSLVHRFDNSDQGRIGLVLRDLFGLDPDRVRSVCAPFRVSTWEPSVTEDEILFVRQLDLHKAFSHPVFKHIVLNWFPEGRLWQGEPRAVAVVNPRWMDSGACQMLEGFSDERKNLMFLNCGDMTTHFNGCPKKEYFAKSFREAVGTTPECREQLPFQTNDDNSGPFVYEDWVNAGKNMKPKDIFNEPAHRLQYGV